MNSFILVSALVIAFAVSVSNAGQSCSAVSAESCCKNTETCCTDGCCPFQSASCCGNKKCCPSTHSECCSDGSGCCSSANPVCCSDHCCPTTHSHCCGNGCCPNAYPVCCSGQFCCPSGYYCCGFGQCCSVSGRRKRGVDVSSNSHPLLKTATDEIPFYNEYPMTFIDTAQPDRDIEDNKENIDDQQLGKHSVAKRAVTNLGECFNFERLKLNEGNEPCRYYDTKGIATIGVGFNLEKNGARGKIEAVGANYDRVLKGEECLNDNQIEQLLEEDANTAIACAKQFAPNWTQLHSGARSALADMAFNLGCTGLHRFKCLRSAIGRLDYVWAAAEMRDSAWCGQVKIRCDRNIKCMKNQ